jgi:hypothetical protein
VDVARLNLAGEGFEGEHPRTLAQAEPLVQRLSCEAPLVTSDTDPEVSRNGSFAALSRRSQGDCGRGRRSLGDIIDDALSSLFANRPERAPLTQRAELPVGGGSGLQAGIDLEDQDSLAEALGDNVPFHAVG